MGVDDARGVVSARGLVCESEVTPNGGVTCRVSFDAPGRGEPVDEKETEAGWVVEVEADETGGGGGTGIGDGEV